MPHWHLAGVVLPYVSRSEVASSSEFILKIKFCREQASVG